MRTGSRCSQVLTCFVGQPCQACILVSAPRNERQRFTEANLRFFLIKMPPGRQQKFQQTSPSSVKTVTSNQVT